jgi:hypothetical protein
MESKFFDSSPKVGSAKRGLTDDPQESPTAKRAKRSKHSKKRRSKGEKDSDGYVEQQDWVSFDNGSAPFSPIARQQTPNKPLTPFPLKEAHRAHVQKSAEKAKAEVKNGNKEDEVGDMKDAKESVKEPAAQGSPKTEANTRKTRAEPGSKKEAKDPIDNGHSKVSAVPGPCKADPNPKKHPKHPVNGNPKVPAVAGPSKPRIRKPAPPPKELTPLSDIQPPVDYTFKAFPNPPIIQFPPFKKSKELTESKDLKVKTADTVPAVPAPADNTPKATTTAMELDLDISPIPDAAMAAPAGTKTLKAINKHLKALQSAVTTYPAHLNDAIASLRTDIAHLHSRLDRDELRASIRHEILFNALVKVSSDIGALNARVDEQQQHIQEQQESSHLTLNNSDGIDGDTTMTNGTGTGAGGKDKDKESATAIKDKEKERERERENTIKYNKTKSMQQARKNLEQCLRIYAEDMNRAGSAEEVGRYGGLCVQYAGDLFKTLG